ncbi:unnamed protein product, partial [Rangifer tarandus platyrhynchus]
MMEKLRLLSDYCTFRQKSMGWCPRRVSGTWLSHTFRATSPQRERQRQAGAGTLRGGPPPPPSLPAGNRAPDPRPRSGTERLALGTE